MPADEALNPLYALARLALPAGTDWFDAHTHIGQQRPRRADGHAPRSCSPASTRPATERALVFAMHEPDGYRAANDEVLDAGRGVRRPAVRWPGWTPRRRAPSRRRARASTAGARGIKLHPRSDGFGLPHPVVEELVALAAEARVAVLFHAGRGIPHLGDAAVDLARRHPDARMILAHAGISDLGLRSRRRPPSCRTCSSTPRGGRPRTC